MTRPPLLRTTVLSVGRTTSDTTFLGRRDLRGSKVEPQGCPGRSRAALRLTPFARTDCAGTINAPTKAACFMNPQGGLMPTVVLSRGDFAEDRQGRTFSDVLNDPTQPLDEVLAFFSDSDRQRRMEESEVHHDRAALAGVIRELEAHPGIDAYFGAVHPFETKRLRQAIGVVVRIIMERRGWQKTGRKGSMGVRVAASEGQHPHNTGGLAFWFVRAERYELAEGMPFQSVSQRCKQVTEASRPSRRSNVRT